MVISPRVTERYKMYSLLLINLTQNRKNQGKSKDNLLENEYDSYFLSVLIDLVSCISKVQLTF